MDKLISTNIDVWTAALENKSAAGRGTNNKQTAYGIKKLRELILELAVRGKLVPQDPNDEPATVLLEKIAEEKARLVKEGKIKKQKALPEIGEEKSTNDIPDGWACERLGNVLNVINGRAYKKHEMLQEGTPLLRVGNLFTSNEWYYSNLELEPDKYIDNGDLIYAWSASFGPFIWDGGKVIFHYHIWKLDLFDDLSLYKKYLYLYLLAITEEIKASGSGIAMIHMTKERMEKLVVMVPPLAEQHRIVAKVDELMALCDQLEQQQTDSIAAHQTLVETLLKTLTDSENAEQLAQNWAVLSEHFDTLFTTEHSIAQLKQTILQLAVMGKLVPQDPNDEPVSVLLEKIAEEKECLVKEGKIKKQKELPEISEEEKAFELPEGWDWIKFGYLAEFINGDRGKNYPNRSEYVEAGMPWVNTGHIETNGHLSKTEMNFISQEKYDSLKSGKIKKGDLVYCLRGATFGKTAFVEPYNKGAIASSLMIIRPYIEELNKYIYKYLVSPLGREQIFRFDNGSAQPNLSANSVMLYAFPLPPLAEQHRIVAKVDDLMALCDQLQAQINKAQTTQIHLADAIVEQAIA
ncbi:restriction endonuclease subunit S [Methylotuvimicrobium sp. KM1]|uniref:restriction endonuclease subunit S n=1 Tax=Methylotuvimicrobium sp. KM1 TaxID=3377707 RepID=UPI0038507CD1